MEIKGFKATLWSGMPKYGRRRTPYNVGGIYSVGADLVPCLTGLHFCRQLCYVYNTYDAGFYTRVFEVEARGRLRSDGDKLCTDRMKFVRELTPGEVLMQLAGDANDTYTARFACNKALNILLSVISMDSKIKDLNNNIVSTWSECRGMPALYYVIRRLQWAQAFNEYSDLPICRLVMHDCGITRMQLDKLVETLQKDLILNTDNKEDNK